MPALFTLFTYADKAFSQSDQWVYALNKTAASALAIDGTASLTASSCGVVVDSSSSTAVNLKGTGSLAAKYIDVVGGYASSGSGTISPTPVTGSAYQPDPLSFYNPRQAARAITETPPLVAALKRSAPALIATALRFPAPRMSHSNLGCTSLWAVV